MFLIYYFWTNVTSYLLKKDDTQSQEESLPSFYSQPLNMTIVSGSDAIFTCKLGSNTKAKWMKQISRAEYANFVIQNNPSQLQLLSRLGSLNNQRSTENDQDQSLKSFYDLSTQSPLAPLGTRDKTDQSGETDVDISLSDLIGNKDESKTSAEMFPTDSEIRDESEFNFELFMPKSVDLTLLTSLDSKLNAWPNKRTVMTKVFTISRFHHLRLCRKNN